jgi:hypothetical protein
MNWYLKQLFAQVAQDKAQGITSYLQSLGVSQDVIDHLLILNQQEAQYLIGQIRKDPGITLQDIQSLSMPKKIDPYLPWEKTVSKTDFGIALEKWILTSFRKLRKGMIPNKPVINAQDLILLEEIIGEDNYTNYIFFSGKLNEMFDWYNAMSRDNLNFNISSYSPEQAVAASDKWHKAMAAKGEGLIYDNTKRVLYGPQWKNPEWNGWTIQSVTSENDLLVEGNRMNHCVGDFCKKVESGDSIIYSLRDPQNKPHVTLETNANNEIVIREKEIQIMGNSNSEPKDIYKAMIKEWIQSPNNPGISSFEDDNDPMDEVSGYSYGGEMEELLNILEGLEDNEYGIVRRTTWSADDIAEKAIEIEMSRREPEYQGELTNVPEAIVNMIINDKESSPEYINHQLSMFETYLQELEEEIWEMSMQWDYYGDYPEEEDYETPEEFEVAEEEYRQVEDEYKDEERRRTPQGGFANDGFKLINELAEKGIYKRPIKAAPQSTESV